MTRLDALPERYAKQAFPSQEDFPRPPKYGNRPTEYNGFTYDSRREASFARDLDLMLKAGLLRDWNQQVKVTFEVLADGRLVAWSDSAYLPGKPRGAHVAQRVCAHVVDFILVHADGRVELVEVKSRPTRTAAWSLKRRLLEASLLRENPELTYRIEQ